MRTAHALHHPVSVQTYPWLSSPLLRFLILHILGLVKAHFFYYSHSIVAFIKSSFSVAYPNSPCICFFLLVKSSLFMLPRHFCCIQSSRQGAGAKLSPAGCSLTGGKQLPRCHRLNLQLAAADGDLLRNGFVLYHGNFTPVNSQFSMENG